MHRPQPARTVECLVATLVMGLVAVAPAAADTIRVPQDVPLLQDAVDGATDGDEILVSKGDYPSLVINQKVNLSIRAKGKVRIGSAGDGGGAALQITTCNFISISKLRFESTPGDSVMLFDSEDVTLCGVRVSDAGGRAVHVDDCSDITLEKVRIDGTGLEGIRTDGSQRVTIEKCLVMDTGGDAIALSSGNNALPTDDSTVCRTRIVRPGDDGLDINGSGNHAEKVIVRDADEDAFEVDTDGAGSDNSFLKCKAIKPAFNGFEIGGSMNTLEQSTVVRPGEDGIALRGTGAHEVLKCRVQKPFFDGFFLVGGSIGNTLTDNKVAGASDDGIDVQTTGNAITGNKVAGSDDNGLEVQSTGNTFTENKVRGSGDFDIADSAGGNTYVDNKFKTTNLLFAQGALP